MPDDTIYSFLIFYCQCHGTCVLGLGLVSILLSTIFSDVTERKREFMLHKAWLSEEMTARRGGKANDEEQARQGQERERKSEDERGGQGGKFG